MSRTPKQIKNDLTAWGTGLRIEVNGHYVPPGPQYMNINTIDFSAELCRDALAYIEQLEAEIYGWEEKTR